MQEPDTTLSIDVGFRIRMRCIPLVILFGGFSCGWVRGSTCDRVALFIEDNLVL